MKVYEWVAVTVVLKDLSRAVKLVASMVSTWAAEMVSKMADVTV